MFNCGLNTIPSSHIITPNVSNEVHFGFHAHSQMVLSIFIQRAESNVNVFKHVNFERQNDVQNPSTNFYHCILQHLYYLLF